MPDPSDPTDIPSLLVCGYDRKRRLLALRTTSGESVVEVPAAAAGSLAQCVIALLPQPALSDGQPHEVPAFSVSWLNVSRGEGPDAVLSFDFAEGGQISVRLDPVQLSLLGEIFGTSTALTPASRN